MYPSPASAPAKMYIDLIREPLSIDHISRNSTEHIRLLILSPVHTWRWKLLVKHQLPVSGEILSLGMVLSSLITLGTIVFSMLRMASGLKIC